MADSTPLGMTRSSSFLDSLYGSGSLELVWGNGHVHVQGGSSSGVTPKTPSWDGSFIKAGGTHKLASYLHTCSTQKYQCLPSAAATNSQKQYNQSMVIDSSKRSRALATLERQKPLISDPSNTVSSVPSREDAPPDEQTVAVSHNSALDVQGSHGQYHNQTSSSAGLGVMGKTDTNGFDQALLESSSLCSLGVSNNTKRKHVDTDDSTYLSDNDEEPEDTVKESSAPRVKRSRNAETHNLCERKRRDKINEKMRVLKELIPNCNKMDKASMLDDAIEYLKSLKLQLQIMSMGAGFCMPFMMLPTATHHMINSPHLHLLTGGRMGFSPGSLPQFPITPLPGITDNRTGMFGFPNQTPPMPIFQAPIIPMVTNPSTQPFLAITNVPENPASSQLKASPPNNSYPSQYVEQATKQAPY